MIALFSLLLVSWPGIETSDTIFGRSYLIFESEGARSIINLQRSQHGNHGLKYLNVSIVNNVDDVPYQSILGKYDLKPHNYYTIDLQERTDEILFIVNFVDPCCKDKWVASIEYSEDDDNLIVSYENCTQSHINFESIDSSNVCFSSSLQLGSHCSLFCTCSSLPPDGKCPPPDSAPMIKCNEFDNSFDTCDYNPQSPIPHEMSFYWLYLSASGEGTITSRVVENERAVAFNLISQNTNEMELIFDRVFGSKIDSSKEFVVSFEESFVLTMKTQYKELALRFDVSSQGEVSVFYKNCEQFKMSEMEDCYEGSDMGLFHFCEENGNIFAVIPYKTCAYPTALKKYAEFKLFFTDYQSKSTEVDTLNMDESSDSPGMLHVTFTREQYASAVEVSLNGQIISGYMDATVNRDEDNELTIEMRDMNDHSIEGHVLLIFTEEGNILTSVDGCTQFEINSDKDDIQCRSQFLSQGSFCFCNRNSAGYSDCQTLRNPIVTECTTEDPSIHSTAPPHVLPMFEVLIYGDNSQVARYTLSWILEDGKYTFHKEIDYVYIEDKGEFNTLDVPNGLIEDRTFSVALGEKVTVSLPMGTGELFVLNFVPQLSGVELLYRSCSIGVISLSFPTYQQCIIESSGGFNFRICPGGATGNPKQFLKCSSPVTAQTFNYDLIADLESSYLYVGTARMDLQVFWNEERPDYFDFHMKDYRRFGDVQLLINEVEYGVDKATVFSIGNIVPIDFDVDGKRLFRIELDLNSPIVSVMANNHCEQFKLTDEGICRGVHNIFYNLKFCSKSGWFSQNLLTCHGNTDPPIVIPSDSPHDTYKMHFSYTNNSRTVRGFVSEEMREEGEILERSLLFHWIDDSQFAPFPFKVSFSTMGKTINETTPSYPYSIPFEVDSPVQFRVLDKLDYVLFTFSILIGEKSSFVIYDDCTQFSIDEPEGNCYGTPDAFLCSGDAVEGVNIDPFLTCNPTSPRPLSDLRTFFIYQSGQNIFTWDLMLSKDDESGGWVVEASETGSNTMMGLVVRGNSAASTLTFTISAGETTVFSVIDRQNGQTLDSFYILPSSQSIAVLYRDCTQFVMGEERDTVDCYRLMDTRICTGEPTKGMVDIPAKLCKVMRFSLYSNDYGIVSQRTTDDQYLQELTIVPPKSASSKVEITVEDESSDSFHFVLSNLQMITVSLAPKQSFSLLALDLTTSVLNDVPCRQFEMDVVDSLDACYSDGGIKLCPPHDTVITQSFDRCVFHHMHFYAFSLSGYNQLRITHFPPSQYLSNSYSLLTGTWSYSDSEFEAHTGDKKMKSDSSYALPPDGSAHFSFPSIPSSFSIQLENGQSTSVLHEGCYQFSMEEDKAVCYGDMETSLCEEYGGSVNYPYKQCHSTDSQALDSSTTERGIETTTVGGMSTTIEDDKSTVEEREETTERTSVSTTASTSVPSTRHTTLNPSKAYYASIVLKEVSIGIEKSVDFSTHEGKIVFDVRAVFYSRPDYNIYVDTVEYPYGTPFQEVHHNVGEVLNVTIAKGSEKMMCVELEIHSMECTVLELDDCPQFTLEDNVDECRSSDLLCLCASSVFECPIHDPIETCGSSSPPSSSASTPTTEGSLDTTFLTTIDPTTELTESSSSSQSLPSTSLFSTPSIEINTGPITDSTMTSLPSSPSTPSRTTSTPKKSLDDLSDLANTTISIDNVSQVLEETNLIVEVGNAKMDGTHIYYVSQILYNSANVTGISQSDSLLVLDTLDDCLGASEQSFKDSADNHDQAPQKFLDALPLLVVNSESERLFMSGKLLGFSSQKHSCEDEEDSSVVGLADTEGGFVEYRDVKDGDTPKSSIEIPTEAVCGSSGTHSLFSIHRTTKLFLGGMSYRRLPVKSSWFGSNDEENEKSSQSMALPHSMFDAVEDEPVTEEEVLPEACSKQQSLLEDQPVLTATVLDTSSGETRFVSRDEENGAKMATVTIDLSDSLRPLHGSLSFSWWDSSSLSWSSSDHCVLREGQWGGKVIADCFHLTDFTLIVDGTVNDPCVCDTALIIVGYIISAVSICSLFLVVLATIINRIPSVSRMKAFSFVREDLFRNRFHSVDVLYTISLLFFYLIFTLFHDESVAGHSCVVFAVISYSLLFCTVLLTLFQSYRTIATFSPFPIIRRVLSFASHQIFVCTVSAGAPLLISSILAIVSNFFDRDDGFCWVRPDYITFAVVVPLSVLILNGVICTVLVVIRLYQEQKSQLMTGKNHLKRRIVSVLIMQFTLGMPWVLQYLTLYAPTSTIYHYLFTIVNGSQGIVLLLLYIYRRDRRMTSMRRRRGAAIAARGVQARQMGAKQKREEENEYDEEYDGKSDERIVN